MNSPKKTTTIKTVFPSYGSDSVHTVGMTLREYYAAQAMQALIIDDRIKAPYYSIAKAAFLMADEMLQAGESPTQKEEAP